MNQDQIILIEAGTPDFEMLKSAIARAEETETYVRVYVDGPPACLKVKAYEGEWTPGIESHRPHGGYPEAQPEPREFIIAFEIDEEYDPDQEDYITAHTFCPYCGAEGQIIEVDVAVRWNEFGEIKIDREPLGDLPPGYRWATEYETELNGRRVGGIPGALVVKRTVDSSGTPYTQDEADVAVPDTAIVYTTASTGDSQFDHDSFLCTACKHKVTAPEYFNIEDWI